MAKDIKDNKKKDKKLRRSPAKYIKEVVAELKKVTWPTKKELVKYTIAVVVVVGLFAVIVGGVDFLLTQGISLLSKATG